MGAVRFGFGFVRFFCVADAFDKGAAPWAMLADVLLVAAAVFADMLLIAAGCFLACFIFAGCIAGFIFALTVFFLFFALLSPCPPLCCPCAFAALPFAAALCSLLFPAPSFAGDAE